MDIRCAVKNALYQPFKKREGQYKINRRTGSFRAGALRRAVQEGDEQNGCFMAGQSEKKEQTVEEIIQELIEETKQTILGG